MSTDTINANTQQLQCKPTQYPIAEIEIAPHENSLVVLNTYEDKKQPKGFCVEFEQDVDTEELVKVEVFTRDVKGGFQYLLSVVNKTSQTLGIGVSVL